METCTYQCAVYLLDSWTEVKVLFAVAVVIKSLPQAVSAFQYHQTI